MVGDPLPMVSSTTGAMNSLLDKMTALEAQHPKLGESKSLREDLKRLNDVLHNFASRLVRDALINEWMLQAREVIYDMEDWIDGCLTRPWEPATDIWCSDIAEQVEEFKDQIEDAHDRCRRFALLNRESTSDAGLADAAPSKVIIDAELLYGEAPCLVPVGKPRDMLVMHLTDKEQHRKVVSIVGTGGIGKTALATEIYRQLQGQFHSGAFVYLGRNPCIKTTLISILNQVEPNWRYNMDSRDDNKYCIPWDEQKVIAKLWAILKTRSYFVVLDDVRSRWTWKRISCALPKNDQAPDRILITTCIKDVAQSCCIHPSDVVLHMTGLGEKDSKTLFDSKILVSEKHSRLEVSDEMLKMCDGIPLAITVAAGLLSRKSECLLLKSQMLDQYHSTPQGMRKILEISYVDLPLPVKSCFLYLSAFPENNTIKKDRLMRRWIAEGFIPKRDEESLWETGETYFNELIGRRLIQPSFDDEDDRPIGCTVHGVVVDFMVSLSAEENFITSGAELKSGLFPCSGVRRFCLDCSDENSTSDKDEAYNLSRLHLSRVRSLAFSGNARRMPDLGALKLVRVLDLEDTKGLENKHLESIGRLSLLKYLGLGGTDVTNLPQQIMALDKLSTLDLRRTRMRKLPEFRDTKLVSLVADELVIGTGIGGMQKLEELSKVLLGDDGSLADDVVGLVKLTQLKMLGVRFGRLNDQNETDREGVKQFLEEVGKSNLQSLFLDNYLHGLLDLLVHSWANRRPNYLRKFELRIRGFLPLVPQEMASLIALTHLHIRVSEVEAQGIRVLGNLPSLVLLKLYSDTSPRLTVSSKDGFQCLKVFWYDCQYGGGIMGLQFEAGAMPQLRRLRLDFNVRETMSKFGDLDFGLKHLSCLVQVHATIDCKDTLTASEVEAAETHIRTQVSQNRNSPVLHLNRRGQRSSVKAAEESVIAIHSLDEWDNQIDPNKLVVIHFTARWCGPSHGMAPVFADLASKNPNVIFLKVDVDEMKTIAEQFHVDKMPTFLFMTGGDCIDQVVGARKEELEEKLNLHVALMLSRRL
ncbi:disease resistance protein RGA5-like [Phragmites australis]|uniref:disease resistance protein RGA5-like n=1 Tax=Phragmites australis TaxID=29695 RepID=UPI002D76EA9B|nr:disease resistance protein RGA5-like [Phragmites australis]